MGRHWGKRRPRCPLLVLFLACFLTAALASERFLDTLLLAGLQVEGMTFYFFDDVFLLYLALETAESIFEGFTLLKSDFSQTNYTPKLVPLGRDSYCKVLKPSQVDCQESGQGKWEIWGILGLCAGTAAEGRLVMLLLVHDLGEI